MGRTLITYLNLHICWGLYTYTYAGTLNNTFSFLRKKLANQNYIYIMIIYSALLKLLFLK